MERDEKKKHPTNLRLSLLDGGDASAKRMVEGAKGAGVNDIKHSYRFVPYPLARPTRREIAVVLAHPPPSLTHVVVCDETVRPRRTRNMLRNDDENNRDRDAHEYKSRAILTRRAGLYFYFSYFSRRCVTRVMTVITATGIISLPP